MPRKAWYNLSLSLLISFISWHGLSQSKPDVIYTINDGLASNTVYDMVQDDRGYMWFGTDAGLSRFDGYEFKNYELKDGSPDMDVLKFFKDSKGRIWMYTFNGNVGYIFEDSIYSTSNSKLSKTLDFNSRITEILEFNKKIYFSAYRGPIKIYDPANNTFEEPQIPDPLGTYVCECADELYGIIATRKKKPAQNSYQVAIGVSLVKFHPNLSDINNSFYEEISINDQSFLREGFGYLICDDGLLMTQPNGVNANHLKMFNTRELSSQKTSTLSTARILSLRKFDEKVLVHTAEGLYQYHPKTKQFSLQHLIQENSSSYIDHEGNTWLTSVGNGVHFKSIKKVRSLALSLDEIDQQKVEGNQLLLLGKIRRNTPNL